MAEMTRFQRLIGGLLGENMEGMTEEQRRRLAREGGTAAILGMLSGSGLLGGLEGLRTRRKEQATQAEAARRVSAAEAEMPRITGRLFGGTAGELESLPGGEGGPLTARYRQAPQEALARLYGTQAGRDVAAMAPDLAKVATEGALGRTVGGAVYNPLTGGFTRPPEAAKPRVPVQEVNLNDRVIVYYNDGTTEVLPKGMAPRAGGAGAAPESGARFRIIPPDEMAEKYPDVAPRTVLQEDTITGKITKVQEPSATERATAAGRSTSVNRFEEIEGRFLNQFEKVSTGGMLGMTGVLSSVFDYDDAKLFNSYREQLSNVLRSAFRIPGEGTLSDYEQKLYGLQLPTIYQSRENNMAILGSLRNQIRISAGLPIPEESATGAPSAAPAAPAAPAAAPARPAGTAAPAAAPAAPQFIYRNGRLVPAQPR